MFDHVRAFHRPRTISEAVRLLHSRKDKACMIAGGTDLALRAGRSVTALVDIGRLPLDYIKRDARGLRIGAITSMATLENSADAQELADGILAKAASGWGGLQTRNMATVGGNLVNASPAADLATPLLVLDAKVVLHGARGKRVVPIAEFFSGPHQTAANGLLLAEVIVPATKARCSFQRFTRTETDIALVSAAAAIELDAERRCTSARLALGAVAPVPMRARNAESALVGQIVTPELIERAAEAVAQETQPITDLRASAEYKRELSRVLLGRALSECMQRVEVEQ